MDDIGSLIAKVVLAIIIMNMMLGVIAYLILLERKTAAWMQDRIGPNRVGPKGLLQPIADGVKFILKEEFIPQNADKFLFLLAPVAILTPSMCGFAVIPWGGILEKGSSVLGLWQFPADFPFMVSNASIGVLFVVATAGLATYGVVLGGWASGSKYSFLGGLRAAAQMLSYEVPLSLSLMAVLLYVGTLNLETMVEAQAHYWLGVIPKWNIFSQPVAALIFTVAIFAEANRTPFDLAECESELVGGYHTEYSSMKFALFFLAEYAAMITGSAVMVSLFLGGWHLPWIDHLIYRNAAGGLDQPAVGNWIDVLIKFAVFWGKVVAFIFFYMWIRWTLPRFRFDQLMNLAWRGMIPMSLATLLITGLVVFLQRDYHLSYAPFWILIGNLVVFAVALAILAKRPPKSQNKRLPVPNSRYNPQFAQELAARSAIDAGI
ncbi:MAG TPA: NADH-quinone oxidoreductase subunit NuoH [Phycisphaerae bacterium]|nr:NADH-quinone oxidoreductase subunit NuoH [Phycisphaerae bacterium]